MTILFYWATYNHTASYQFYNIYKTLRYSAVKKRGYFFCRWQRVVWDNKNYDNFPHFAKIKKTFQDINRKILEKIIEIFLPFEYPIFY